jgi:hypothetical protein
MTIAALNPAVTAARPRAAATWETWTSWYSLAIIAVTLPSGWLGARFLK